MKKVDGKKRSIGQPTFGGRDPKDSWVLSGKRAAPQSKFRLIGVDTFEGPFADFLAGDFVSKDDAIREPPAGQVI